MKRLLLTFATVVSLFSIAALAESPSGKSSGNGGTPSGKEGAAVSGSNFDKLDANKDGKIDRSEAQGAPKVASEFDKMDMNHDGAISREEVAKLQEKAKGSKEKY